MIKALVVDDSKVQREFIVHLLSSDPEIRVVGMASSGKEGIELARLKRPDIITIDMHMPELDGFETTKIIMQKYPTPIVIVSGSAVAKEVASTFKTLEAGALAVVLCPPGFEHPQFSTLRTELIQTVKLMSEVKVIRRIPNPRIEIAKSKLTYPIDETGLQKIEIVAIGASTGGPIALEKILSRLPHDLPVPVLIVQHITAGFITGFTEWLSKSSSIKLKVAVDGEPARNGTGYLAPDNAHMGIDANKIIRLGYTDPEHGLRPSVSYLFRTVAENFGPNGAGILLTGMGKDGADELRLMKDKGAFTIVQNEESSIVFGMPGEALRIGAADQALSPEKIAELLISLCKKTI